VVASSNVQFCGENVASETEYPNGVQPGQMEFIFDVQGTGQVGLGAQDLHQIRGGYLLNSASTDFDTAVCTQVQ